MSAGDTFTVSFKDDVAFAESVPGFSFGQHCFNARCV